jgi:DHA2 family multidrug resistance protein
MAPRGIGTMIAMQISGHILSRVDARLPILVGMLLLAYALNWMSNFTADVGAQEIVLSGMVQGLGLGFIFVPLSAVTFSTLAPEFRGDGTSLYSLLRNVGSSVGIALAFAYQDYGTKMAHSVLAENVNAFNPALIEYVNSSNGLNGVNALLGVESELQRQSAVMGMLGDFHYMALGVLCAIPMLLFLRPGRLGKSNHDAVMD